MCAILKALHFFLFLFFSPFLAFFYFLFFTIIAITCEVKRCEHKPRCIILMPARKMRVELFDGEGNKYTVSFQGQISREKALRLLDLVELLGGGLSNAGNPELTQTVANNELSKYEKVCTLVHRQFPMVWFTSREVQAAYEQEFKEPISLSTVATYFSRMANKGMLVKSGTSNRLKYKVASTLLHAALKQQGP